MNKINLITHEFFPKRGGAGSVVEELASAASSIGKSVRVLVPENDTAHEWPFTVQAIPNSGSHSFCSCLKTYSSMRRLQAEFKDSVVHLAEPGPILACIYAQLTGFVPVFGKLILTFHGSEILRFSRRTDQRSLLQKFIKYADKLHFLSKACRDLFLEFYTVDTGRIAVLPGAPSKFRKKSDAELILPDRAGKIVCLTVGRIHPRKGQHNCIEAIRRLPESLISQIQYWVVGPVVDAKYFQRLQDLADQPGLDISFIGEVEDGDLPIIYSEADIFIMTSVPYRQSVEGFGLVYLDAAKHGLPVIAHDIGGVAEAVKDGESAILCEPGNVDGLILALKQLLENKKARDEMGNNGKKFSDQFSWENMAKELYG
ncbi:MAG: glycosyltransferase family 4 protein [Opitutae bacterium]|nr:glycosyltransferase family 4 protein [Opitutae bacterium]